MQYVMLIHENNETVAKKELNNDNYEVVITLTKSCTPKNNPEK